MKKPVKKGEGVRYFDRRGRLIELSLGTPPRTKGPSDPMHLGPYVKVEPSTIRIPLKGNPVLNESTESGTDEQH